jgi:hypothetical protein
VIVSMLIKFAAVLVLGAEPIAVLAFEVVLNATHMFNHGNVSGCQRSSIVCFAVVERRGVGPRDRRPRVTRLTTSYSVDSLRFSGFLVGSGLDAEKGQNSTPIYSMTGTFA